MLAVTSSLLSLKSSTGSWAELLRWGGYRSLPPSLSLSLISWANRKGGRKEKCGTAASDLWRLAWFSLLVTFELCSSKAWRWLPLRRHYEHINVKHAAWNLQAQFHYTVFTQYAPYKNIGSICICFVWREMSCQDHIQLEHGVTSPILIEVAYPRFNI